MSNELGLAPISHIKENLDRLLGVNAWIGWELETISSELKVVFNELTLDKISLLQVLAQDSTLPYTDMSFFLHATDVINNKAADFDSLPMPTSLELAYAIEEFKVLKMFDMPLVIDSNSDIVDVVSYLLREEGYSEPIYPFGFIPVSKLVSGQLPIDIEAKKMAIDLYIKNMKDL